MDAHLTATSVNPPWQKWLDALRPLRVLVVAAESRHAAWREALQPLLDASAAWGSFLPSRFQPTVVTTTSDALDGWSAEVDFDLALCPESFDELPVGVSIEVVRQLRRRARFVGLTTPPTWSPRDWQSFEPLATARQDGRFHCLLPGGRSLRELDRRAGVIWYLAPNRQIYGGVKILYHHVESLNRLGLPAVIAAKPTLNWPATWFPWDPAAVAFANDSLINVGPNDTVVIPEFKWREVRHYAHAARRLLFVQGPGLCRAISDWPKLGYDGILTLNAPGDRVSHLQQFLQERTTLPMFPIMNPYDDQPWGKTSAPKIPGRVLCQPRKGPLHVDRLRQRFPTLVGAANLRQSELAVEYARADVFVQTGYPEGQPMPPIEAMLSGCVVCGFTGGGGADAMIDGVTAFVATDGDDEQLHQAVQQALHDPRREQVRQQGQQWAAQFRRSATEEDLRRCYTDWLPQLPAAARLSLLTRLFG